MASKERNDQGAQTMEGSRERESHSLSHSYKTVMTESETNESDRLEVRAGVGKRQVGNVKVIRRGQNVQTRHSLCPRI